MKKFTKLFLALALLVVGVGTANAEIKTYWDPSTAFGAGWNSETSTASWDKNDNGWYLLYTGFTPKVQNNSTPVDLSLYTKLVVNISSLEGVVSDDKGGYIEFKVRSNGKSEQAIKLYKGENNIVFKEWADKIDFSKMLEITLSGTLASDAEAGSAVITEMYLYTDRYEYQTQQQTVYTNTLGAALPLSDIVTNNTLVSIASGNDILYGKANDGSQYGSNQIKLAALDDAMNLISGDDNTSYQFQISVATDEGLEKPDGISTLYRIKAFKADGTTPFIGPSWNGGNSFYLQEISWTYNVADGTDKDQASFFDITPVDGKTNIYKISSYKKDGSAGYKENIYDKTEWTFNILTQTPQQVDVQVPVEVFVPDTEDPGIPEVADGWVTLIENGKLDNDNVTNFRTKNEDGGEIAAVIDATCGRNNGPGIKVVTKNNATNEWGTQFFVKSSEALKVGQKFHIEFDYRADRPIDAATQAHMAPGSYNCNIGSIDFTVNWKHFSETYEVTADMCKNGDMLSFGLNLSHDRKTNNFYFDNIVLWTEDVPLKAEKIALQNAIANANGRTLGKTEASASTLSNAITAGQTALNATDATAESLTNAKTAIDDAIKGLKYAAGYAKVTKNMFMTWDGDGADANATGVSSAGVDNIGVVNAGVPYGFGTGNIYWNHYADLTPYEKLYAIGTKGKQARYVFNRPQDPSNPTGEGTSGFFQKYIDIDENGVAEFTLSEAGEFAHLNSFKRPQDGTTFTEFFVYAKKTNVKVGNAGYATFSSIMNVDLSGVTGYAAQYDGSKVNLTPITEYPAGAAIIIEAAEGSYSLTNIESADAIANNDLKVSDGSIAGDGTIYVLAKKSDVVGFYKLKDGEKVPAGKAYLKIENSGSSREFIAIDGGATAIKSVETEKANGAVYNLAGQQVKNAQKGVFIMNGKKVIK